MSVNSETKSRSLLSQDGARRDERVAQMLRESREKAAAEQRRRDQQRRDERLAMLNNEAPEPTGAAAKPQFLSPKEFSVLVGIGPATVFRHLRDGSLKSTMFGGRRLIPFSEIERLHNAAAE
jgi:excisionase family DNA binding protein